MSAIRLLVLGAVRRHGRAHGYQVRNDLERWGADYWGNTKPGSIYHALKQMARQGLLHAYDTAPSTAGGPPRTEYEINDAGNAEYFTLLREALVTPDKLDLFACGLGFMVDLPRDEVVDLLRQRIKALEAWHESVTEHPPSELGYIAEIVNLWAHSAHVGVDFTRALISRIEGGAHSFAGEGGDPFAGVLAED